MSRAIIVFGKRPTPGAVKTRLAPPLTSEEAAELYQAFLEDVVRQYVGMELDVRLYLTGETEGVLDIPDEVVVREQAGGGLGERMLRAFGETFGEGYRYVAIVGTDHPSLPPAFVAYAFEALDVPRTVVVGPAEDGGYYLLGMNDLRPGIFRGMTYSHPDVLEQTIERITSTGARLTVLPSWYDVDRPEELRRLIDDLEPELAPRTANVLRRLGDSHAWLGQFRPQ